MASVRVVALQEYKPCNLEASQLPTEVVRAIDSGYGTQIQVERAKYTEGWILTSKGWVGYLPITPGLHLALQPKTSIHNLFGMLEYAYKVGKFLEGNAHVDSLQELYERLARVLAERVMARCRQGLYREYLSRQEALPFLRGRLDVSHHIRMPWSVSPRCEHQEHTPDIEDNQLVAWTLYTVASSAWCGGAQASVRQALRCMGAGIALQTFDANACLGRLYNRLNDDYGPLHALCRFFLANSGPACHSGDWRMVPFLVNMADLFETFVAEWLRRNLSMFHVQLQFRYVWDPEHALRLEPDVVLRDPVSRAPACVLDTKYKLNEAPKGDDVHQVVAYAVGLGCREAVLVYPFRLDHPTDADIGPVHVRTVGFPIDGDLDAAGQAFIEALVAGIAISA